MAEASIPSDFTEGGQLFVRNATGLVREVSKWDALIINTLGINVALGAVFMLLQAPGNFPGGSMLLSIVIGTLVMAFTLLWVYAESPPRCHARAVTSLRQPGTPSDRRLLARVEPGDVAHLLLDRLQRVVLPDLRGPGGPHHHRGGHRPLELHHPERPPAGQALVLGMNTQWWVIVVGAVLTFGFAALLIYGSQWYWRVQKWLFGIAGLSIVLVAGLLLFKSGDIAAHWNSLAAQNKGLAYDQIVSSARSAGFNPSHGFSLSATILMLPWVFFVVGYAQGSAQIGGEVKRDSRTQYFWMVGGVLIDGAVLAVIVLIYKHAVGSQSAAASAT